LYIRNTTWPNIPCQPHVPWLHSHSLTCYRYTKFIGINTRNQNKTQRKQKRHNKGPKLSANRDTKHSQRNKFRNLNTIKTFGISGAGKSVGETLFHNTTSFLIYVYISAHRLATCPQLAEDGFWVSACLEHLQIVRLEIILKINPVYTYLVANAFIKGISFIGSPDTEEKRSRLSKAELLHFTCPRTRQQFCIVYRTGRLMHVRGVLYWVMSVNLWYLCKLGMKMLLWVLCVVR
jgi:hypothetical protein